jgi:hypothetical protein
VTMNLGLTTLGAHLDYLTSLSERLGLS